jgi:hypothetical protein
MNEPVPSRERVEELLALTDFTEVSGALEIEFGLHKGLVQHHCGQAIAVIANYGFHTYAQQEAQAFAVWQMLQLLTDEPVEVSFKVQGALAMPVIEARHARLRQVSQIVTVNLVKQSWDVGVLSMIGMLRLDKHTVGMTRLEKLYELLDGMTTLERAGVLAVRGLREASRYGILEGFGPSFPQDGTPADLDALGAQLDRMELP